MDGLLHKKGLFSNKIFINKESIRTIFVKTMFIKVLPTKSQVHIVRKSYQGQHSLEGNQCSDFLKKLDTLEMEIMSEPSELIIAALPFVQTLRAFRKVQKSCFGLHLEDDYKEKIKEFSQLYRGLEITITPKVKRIFVLRIDIF